MSPEKDTLEDGYQLVDGDRDPFDGFDEARFEAWLRVGLEGYLLEDQGAWAFPGAEGSIAQEDYLVLGLRDAYLGLNAQGKGHFRQAVAKVLASLDPDEKYVRMFEHLLALAAALPAPEVLRVLPARVGNGFFGLTDNREGESLFALSLLTAAQLSAPREEAVKCLHALISSEHFDHAYAGIALNALCKADDRGLVDHLARLRKSLAAMFRQFRPVREIQKGLARSVLDTAALHQFVQALPSLKYFDRHDRTMLDTWLVDATLRRPGPPLVCGEKANGQLYFFRSGRDDVTELLPEEGEGLGDLIHLLRQKHYIQVTPVAIPLRRSSRQDAKDLTKSFGMTYQRAA